MARRQIEIPGTERTDVDPALLDAGEKYLDLRRVKRRASDNTREAKHIVLALMASHAVVLFEIKDPETGEVIQLELDNEPKLRTKKTGNVGDNLDPGDGIPSAPPDEHGGIPRGLIAEALQAQADAAILETTDGDVVVPDVAAPKKPKKRKAKASA